MGANMKTSEILNKAADLIEERGWGQGASTWVDYGVGFCLEGALAAVIGVEPRGWERSAFTVCPAYSAVRDFLQDDDRWGIFRTSLYSWNDVPGRTAEEVIEVLRAAAVIEESREAEPAKVSVA